MATGHSRKRHRCSPETIERSAGWRQTVHVVHLGNGVKELNEKRSASSLSNHLAIHASSSCRPGARVALVTSSPLIVPPRVFLDPRGSGSRSFRARSITPPSASPGSRAQMILVGSQSAAPRGILPPFSLSCFRVRNT